MTRKKSRHKTCRVDDTLKDVIKELSSYDEVFINEDSTEFSSMELNF